MSNSSPSLLLSVIVVSYNTSALTVQTLQSLIKELKSSKKLANSTEIFLVDNDSKDDSVAAVRQLFRQENWQKAKIISNKHNLGFAAANNQALRQSKGAYLFLLNSDTIVKKGAVQSLIKAFEDRDIEEKTAHLKSSGNKIDRLGILSPTLLNQDGSFQAHGGSLPSLRTIASQMLFLDDLPWIGRFFPSTQHTGRSDFAFQTYRSNSDRLIQKDWVGGTAMMIRRLVLDEIGLLDENIFMYGEDQEFCMRAKNHHFDIAIDPQATIIHFGSASSTSKNAVLGELKGYLYIFRKHKPSWQLPLLKNILLLGVNLRILLYNGTRQALKASIYKEARAILKA